ncbi:MAG TPA: S9 family peptidase [Terriglobia bacterium]|nr:S9 family peptidase [Terriglobia bacterium]
MPPEALPYGSWPSAITSALLTSSGVSLAAACLSGGSAFWLEGRPLEGGRVAIVQDGVDRISPPFNARTRAHEYGGGAFTVHDGVVYFTNFADQRLYRLDRDGALKPIVPEPPAACAWRYADMRISPDGQRVIAVRERHEADREAINELVTIASDGSGEPRILVDGHDFFASPRLSPDGRRLAWLTWDHPNMPWDGTELWRADLTADCRLGPVEKVAGGPSESIFQPEWSPDGRLHYISDRTGWWNLYAEGRALHPMDAEFGLPQWVFGLSRYGFLSDGRIACIYTQAGEDRLAILAPATGNLETLALPYTSYSHLSTDGDYGVVIIAGSATRPTAVVTLDVHTRQTEVRKLGMHIELSEEDLSAPEAITYPSENGRSAHALYYAPKSGRYIGPADERPPLLVVSHGGPTSAASSSLKLSIQYWTNRGFAVVDVDYGGSSGYGRAYRELLNGRWGIVDVEDCVAAVRYLARRGDIDPGRAAIRGGSAGGYTTLCALVFQDVFAAGASHYGVGDLTALARDTHKFESRYLDRLIGPYPAATQLYHDRSPLNFASRLSCPVILFQGLDDKVVPPNQAETFAAALQAKGIDHEYVALPNEGHGFRRAESIQRVAEAELQFYRRVFGMAPPPPM